MYLDLSDYIIIEDKLNYFFYVETNEWSSIPLYLNPDHAYPSIIDNYIAWENIYKTIKAIYCKRKTIYIKGFPWKKL